VLVKAHEFFLNQTFLCNEVRGDFADLSRAALTSSTILWAGCLDQGGCRIP